MAFALTLIYTALSLLSPSVLPDEIVALHIAEILGVLAILACIPRLSEARLLSIPETYLALGLVLATTISSIATGWLGGTPAVLMSFLPIVFNFFFISVSCKSLRHLRIMTAVLLLVAIFVIIQGALAEANSDFLSPYLEGERMVDMVLYRHRGLGVLNDPNDFAQFLVLLLPLLWLRWKKKKHVANLLFTLLPAAILLWGLYLTHSRGGIVALLVVILFGFKDKLGTVVSVVITGLATAGVVALNVSGGRGLNEDDGGRVAAWITGLEVFKSHPLVGVGVNNFGNYNETGLTAHNSYILCMAELGLFGYFFWMGMIVVAWNGLSLILKHGAPNKPAEEHDEQPGIALPEQPQEAVSLPVPADPPLEPWMQPETAPAEPGDYIHAAKVLRVSLVGLLTASFFLSRTYSMTLYVLLGMAVALRNCVPFSIELNRPRMLKQTGLVMVASIVFLYLFVRIRGVS